MDLRADFLNPPAGVQGLTSNQAQQLLMRGHNIVTPEPTWQRWRKYLGPLTDPMVLLLLIAAPTYFFIGDVQDAVVTLIAIVPIIAVGWVLESKAHRTLKKLGERIARQCYVLRDGQVQRIPSTHLVVGDIVLVHEGDVVSADMSLIHAADLFLDESALTGESSPVRKSFTTDAGTLLAGTTIMSGRAYCQVTATGQDTEYGRIGLLLARSKKPKTPLQRAITRLVRLLVTGALLFSVAVVLVEHAHGHSWPLAVIAGVSLLIAVLPEEFPIVYSLYLSLGAWKLSKDHALIRDLPGVETLGSVTVICTDKTGTLTTGHLSLDGMHSQTLSTRELLTEAVLACERSAFDPLDQAIVHYAQAHEIDVPAVHSQALVREWAFDAAMKRVTYVWESREGAIHVASKGTYEGLSALSRMTDDDRRIYDRIHSEFASQGMRILALSVGHGSRDSISRDVDESQLELVGLLAFRDPPREHVPASLRQCYEAGIRIIMVTGDHPDTALAIAESIGLVHADGTAAHVSSGADLENSGDRDLLIRETDVFARIRPDQKHFLVESLRNQGEVVAMTGDGVNDAAALRAAHIGIAMGQRGTDVAREAATMVLLDDDFSTIVTAARNGRRIYDNLTMAFAYLIAIHVPLAVVGLAIPLMGLPLLLLPIQLIVLEIVVHPIVALVFEAQPAAPNVMQRPPRPSEYAMTWDILKRPFAMGFRLSVSLVLAYWLALHWGWTDVQARGMGFSTLLLVQPFLIVAVSLRQQDGTRLRRHVTTQFTVSYIAIALVTVLSMYWPAFGSILKVSTFPSQGLVLIVFSLLVTVIRLPKAAMNRPKTPM